MKVTMMSFVCALFLVAIAPLCAFGQVSVAIGDGNSLNTYNWDGTNYTLLGNNNLGGGNSVDHIIGTPGTNGGFYASVVGANLLHEIDLGASSQRSIGNVDISDMTINSQGRFFAADTVSGDTNEYTPNGGTFTSTFFTGNVNGGTFPGIETQLAAHRSNGNVYVGLHANWIAEHNSAGGLPGLENSAFTGQDLHASPTTDLLWIVGADTGTVHGQAIWTMGTPLDDGSIYTCGHPFNCVQSDFDNNTGLRSSDLLSDGTLVGVGDIDFTGSGGTENSYLSALTGGEDGAGPWRFGNGDFSTDTDPIVHNQNFVNVGAAGASFFVAVDVNDTIHVLEDGMLTAWTFDGTNFSTVGNALTTGLSTAAAIGTNINNIPEPSSLLLLGLATSLIGIARSKRG